METDVKYPKDMKKTIAAIAVIVAIIMGIAFIVKDSNYVVSYSDLEEVEVCYDETGKRAESYWLRLNIDNEKDILEIDATSYRNLKEGMYKGATSIELKKRGGGVYHVKANYDHSLRTKLN